jgi:hypothetical protein
MLQKSTIVSTQKHEFIRVDNDFCQVLEVLDVDAKTFKVTLRLKVKVLLSESIKAKQNAIIVSVLDGVKDSYISQNDVIDASQKATIDGIKTFLQKKLKQASLNYQLLKSSRIDITSKVDNSQLGMIKNGQYADMKLDFIVANVDDDKKQGKNLPFVVSTGQKFLEKDQEIDVGSFFDKLMKINGIDPSDVLEQEDLSILTYASVLGSKSGPKFNKNYTELFENYKSFLLNSTPSTSTDQLGAGTRYLKPVVRDVSQDYVTFTKDMTFEIPNNSSLFNNIRIKFDLVDIQNSIVSSIKKDIDMMKLVNIRFLPRKYLNVKSTRTEDKISFSITSDDESTKGVQIFVKTIKDTINDHDPNYDLIADLSFSTQTGNKQIIWSDLNVASFRDKNVSGVTNVYRFLPYGINPFKGKIVSSLFKNIVINHADSYANINVPIICLSTEQGIQVITPKLPKNCVSINIMKRDITRHDQTYQFIGSSIVGANNILDKDVINEHVYEYVCRVNYDSGQYKDVGRKVIKFIKQIFASSQTKITINNVKLDQSINDVKFDISVQRQNSDQNLLKKILEDQGLLSYFNSEIAEDRTKLEDLLAFRISRIDMQTGVIDKFNVTNNRQFSDFDLRSNANISPPKAGMHYKYVVDALFRIPISTIPNLVLTGSIAGQQYFYNPSKYFHPLALKYGIFGDENSVKLRYAENFMEFGDIGLSANVDVTTAQNPSLVQLENLNVQFIDDLHEAVSCNVNGPLDLVDHFLIIRSCSGVKSIVGRATPIEGSINAIVEVSVDVAREPRNYSIIMVKK